MRKDGCAAFIHSLKAAFPVLLELGHILDDYVFITENEMIKKENHSHIIFIHNLVHNPGP